MVPPVRPTPPGAVARRFRRRSLLHRPTVARGPGRGVWGSGYPFGVQPPSLIFADDNSAARRAARREAEEARRREERRREILAALRRAQAEAEDPDLVAARERARRHQELLERYPADF